MFMGSKRRASLVLLATANCATILVMLFHGGDDDLDGALPLNLSPTAHPPAFDGLEAAGLPHLAPTTPVPPGPGPGFLPGTPVLILAHNRSAYLNRSLHSVLAAAGATPADILVSIDGDHPGTEEVARALGIRVAALPQSRGQPAGRVCFHHKRSLALAFKRHPAARHVIVLEEDLQVARDIFSYFRQTIPLLDLDPTLLLISAWNDHGYMHASNDVDSSQIFRTERMSGLGWVCSRTLFEELEPKWPDATKNWDWDQWLRLPTVSRGRHTIVPGISRTHHFGAEGVHMTAAFQRLYFDGRRLALNTELLPAMQVDGASSAEAYDRELARFISSAVTFPTSPCTAQLRPGQDYVLFIKQGQPSDNGEPDYSNWLKLARCFEIWDLDVRGQYKSTWRLWWQQSRVVVVGSNSPFARPLTDSSAIREIV